MVAGCDEKIKVFKFQNGMLLEDRKLIGHTNVVYCLLFSKKCNWFASGSYDNTIRCWKENCNEWISSKS
jgi:WD40 repeat protein